MRYILFGALFLSIFSCKSKEKLVEENKEEMETQVDGEFPTDLGNIQLSYAKGACFGRCPTFIMEIYDKGYAKFKGKLYTEKRGLWQIKLTKAQLKNIELALEEADLMNKPSKYESNIPDLPRTTFLYYKGDIEKSVTGKEYLPEEVVSLSKTLDQIIESNSWIVIDGEFVEEEEPKVNLDEIIVEFKKGVGLPNWFKQKKDLGIWLKGRVSEENNSWIIGYKRSDNKPEEILEILKNDESIKSAEFNKVVSNR